MITNCTIVFFLAVLQFVNNEVFNIMLEKYL